MREKSALCAYTAVMKLQMMGSEGCIKMDGKYLRMWRKTLGLSQKDAAEALGLKLRILQYYEKGERDGKPIKAPKAVRLACWALTQGRHDFTNEDVKACKDKVPRKKMMDSPL